LRAHSLGSAVFLPSIPPQQLTHGGAGKLIIDAQWGGVRTKHCRHGGGDGDGAHSGRSLAAHWFSFSFQ